MNRVALAVALALLLTPWLTAAFEGPYAPDQWTFIPGPGGSLKTHTADELTIVGGDIFLVGDTDITIAAAATGMWSFDWTFVDLDVRSGFDHAYYLLNGVEIFLATGDASGSISLSVQPSDTIGFRVKTVDGVFGPGVLTITNFSAPVPAPPAFAFILAVLGSPGRRRRYDASHDSEWHQAGLLRPGRRGDPHLPQLGRGLRCRGHFAAR